MFSVFSSYLLSFFLSLDRVVIVLILTFSFACVEYSSMDCVCKELRQWRWYRYCAVYRLCGIFLAWIFSTPFSRSSTIDVLFLSLSLAVSQVSSPAFFSIRCLISASIVVRSPPFEISEQGWGVFEIRIRITPKHWSQQKTELSHLLKLYRSSEQIIETVESPFLSLFVSSSST